MEVSMDIQKMKKLEDTRVEYEKVSREHSNLFTSAKQKLFATATEEFSTFFKNKDFLVKDKPPEISATYKNLVVTLSFPKAEENFVGAYSVLKMSISNPKEDYRITVNELGVHTKSFNIETTISTGTKQAIDEVQKQIDKLSKEIMEMKARGDSFKTVKLGYTLYHGDKSKTKFPQFDSMANLLAELFK
jgi:hypothetical protein